MKPEHPLKKFMQDHGLTKEATASLLGTTPGYLNHILSWQRFPGRKMAWRMRELMGKEISLEDLLPRTDDTKRNHRLTIQ